MCCRSRQAWFGVAAVVTWLVCAASPLLGILRSRSDDASVAVIVVAFASFGIALMLITRMPQSPSPSTGAIATLLGIESAAAIVFNIVAARYSGGTGMAIGLLVIVSTQLPFFFDGRVTSCWIAVQTCVLTALFFPPNAGQSVTIGLGLAAFQAFAALASAVAIQEARGRNALAAMNAELLATRELLAESARAAERIRISRDLHDTLGHHLTALSIQLDVAASLVEGKGADYLRQAHAIARLLLSDVRNAVSTLRRDSTFNLAQALRAAARQPTFARIHLNLPDIVDVDDPGHADAILKAVQECITNTNRHAQARNIWIDVSSDDRGILLVAKDDGVGADVVRLGNGLQGMRERFAACGGTVECSSEGRGFSVRAWMPSPTERGSFARFSWTTSTSFARGSGLSSN